MSSRSRISSGMDPMVALSPLQRDPYSRPRLFDRLTVQWTQEGARGVFAKQTIPNRTRIVEIPEHHLITKSFILKSNARAQSLFQEPSMQGLRDSNALFIYHLYCLFRCRESSSPLVLPTWEQTYLDLLPSHPERSSCLSLSRADVRLLTGTVFHDACDCGDRRAAARHHPLAVASMCSICCYQKYYEWMRTQLRIPVMHRMVFRKAVVLVNSRIFSFYDRGFGKERSALVPVADLLNHHPTKCNTKWYFDSSIRCFIVETTRDISQGEEVYDSYGRKTDIQLYYTYGFYLSENKYGEIIIPQHSRYSEAENFQRYLRRLESILRTMEKKQKNQTLSLALQPLFRLFRDQQRFLLEAAATGDSTHAKP